MKRNALVFAMNKRHVGRTKMKDSRQKRINNLKNSWKGELQ